jgi:hypothetical protein
MYPYVIFTITVAALVIAGVIRRTRRSGRGNALAQLAGGLNVFAAALLAFMTFAILFISLNNQLRLGTEFIVGSSLVFVVVICLYWVFLGLVPIEIVPGSNGKLLLGHFLLIVGTVAHGSVTFFMPFLVWVGLISNEATAVLPWLAFLTFPAAFVLWVIGLTLIWKSNSNNLLEGTHEH